MDSLAELCSVNRMKSIGLQFHYYTSEKDRLKCDKLMENRNHEAYKNMHFFTMQTEIQEADGCSLRSPSPL